MNYTELTTAIQDYVQSDETTFVSNIPRFVRNAEDRILRTVQLPVFRKISTTSVGSGNGTLALPSDFLSPYSLAAIDSNNIFYWLYQVDPEAVREGYPIDSGGSIVTGTPKVYGLYDHDTIVFGPHTDATYTFELRYFHRPDSIVDNSTSWLGDNAESVLLYGALIEAGVFIKEERDILEGYKQLYDEGMARLKNFGEGMSRTDAYKEIQVKTGVS